MRRVAASELASAEVHQALRTRIEPACPAGLLTQWLEGLSVDACVPCASLRPLSIFKRRETPQYR
jgi:hypothetical protein